MRKFFSILVSLAFLVSNALNVNAFGIASSGDISLTSDTRKQSVTLSLTDLPEGTNLKKIKYKAKLDKKAKSLFSFSKKGVVKFDSDGRGTLTAKAKSKASKKLDGQNLESTYTLTPSKKARKLGAETGSGSIRFTSGETTQLSLANNFGGDPVLPKLGSNALVLSPNQKALSTGVPFRISFPANAGSCGVGIGGPPLSTTAGPGGTSANFNANGAVNIFGTGSSTDPYIISFNNVDKGSENVKYDVAAFPENLVVEGGVPGFAQFYEGANATGQVLASIEGIITVDLENQRLNLTSPQGIVISYSDSGEKDITVPAGLADIINDVGGLDSALGFLSGGTIPITIPANLLNTALSSGLQGFQADVPNVAGLQALGLDNVSVSFTKDVSGTLQQVNNKVTGTFTGAANVSFDIAQVGNIAFLSSSSDNFTATFEAASPAVLSGFTLTNALANFSLTGGTGLVNSVRGTIALPEAKLDLASGISSTNPQINNISTVPSIDELINNSNNGGGGPTIEECISQCLAQGADAATCQTACAAQFPQ